MSWGKSWGRSWGNSWGDLQDVSGLSVLSGIRSLGVGANLNTCSVASSIILIRGQAVSVIRSGDLIQSAFIQNELIKSKITNGGGRISGFSDKVPLRSDIND